MSGWELYLWSIYMIVIGVALGLWVRRPLDVRIEHVDVKLTRDMIEAWCAANGLRLVHEGDFTDSSPPRRPRMQ